MGWITVLHMPFTFNRQTQDFLCENFRAAREWKLQGLLCSQLATSTVSLPLHATGQIKSQTQPRFTGAKTKNQPPSGTVSVTLQRGMQSQGRISVRLFYFFLIFNHTIQMEIPRTYAVTCLGEKTGLESECSLIKKIVFPKSEL